MFETILTKHEETEQKTRESVNVMVEIYFFHLTFHVCIPKSRDLNPSSCFRNYSFNLIVGNIILETHWRCNYPLQVLSSADQLRVFRAC